MNKKNRLLLFTGETLGVFALTQFLAIGCAFIWGFVELSKLGLGTAFSSLFVYIVASIVFMILGFLALVVLNKEFVVLALVPIIAVFILYSVALPVVIFSFDSVENDSDVELKATPYTVSGEEFEKVEGTVFCDEGIDDEFIYLMSKRATAANVYTQYEVYFTDDAIEVKLLNKPYSAGYELLYYQQSYNYSDAITFGEIKEYVKQEHIFPVNSFLNTENFGTCRNTLQVGFSFNNDENAPINVTKIINCSYEGQEQMPFVSETDADLSIVYNDLINHFPEIGYDIKDFESYVYY